MNRWWKWMLIPLVLVACALLTADTASAHRYGYGFRSYGGPGSYYRGFRGYGFRGHGGYGYYGGGYYGGFRGYGGHGGYYGGGYRGGFGGCY